MNVSLTILQVSVVEKQLEWLRRECEERGYKTEMGTVQVTLTD